MSRVSVDSITRLSCIDLDRSLDSERTCERCGVRIEWLLGLWWGRQNSNNSKPSEPLISWTGFSFVFSIVWTLCGLTLHSLRQSINSLYPIVLLRTNHTYSKWRPIMACTILRKGFEIPYNRNGLLTIPWLHWAHRHSRGVCKQSKSTGAHWLLCRHPVIDDPRDNPWYTPDTPFLTLS